MSKAKEKVLPCELIHDWHAWGESWTGTKSQLQAVGIGEGIQFPGEPGANRETIRTVDSCGLKVEITHESWHQYLGKFRASCRYLDREFAFYSYRRPTEHAPGVLNLRAMHDSDEYRGSGPALIACGLARLDQLPGQPNRGKVASNFGADGLASFPKDLSWKVAGFKNFTRVGIDRFVVSIQVSEIEAARREAWRLDCDERKVIEHWAARLVRENYYFHRPRKGMPMQASVFAGKVPSCWQMIFGAR